MIPEYEWVRKTEIYKELRRRAVQSHVCDEWIVTKTDVLRALEACAAYRKDGWNEDLHRGEDHRGSGVQGEVRGGSETPESGRA